MRPSRGFYEDAHSAAGLTACGVADELTPRPDEEHVCNTGDSELSAAKSFSPAGMPAAPFCAISLFMLAPVLSLPVETPLWDDPSWT